MQARHLIRIVPNDQLDDLISAFLDDCRLANLSNKTLRFYEDNLRRFRWWCGEAGVTLAPAAHTASTVRDFLRYVQTEPSRWGKPEHFTAANPAGPSTVHAYHRVLRRFYNWLVEQEYLEASPMGKVRAPRIPKSQPDPFSTDELRRLATALGDDGEGFLAERNRAIIAVLLDVGLRASEIASIQVEHYNVTTGDLYVEKAKGGKPRTVRVGARARRVVRRYWMRYRTKVADAGPLFLTSDATALTAQGVHDITTKLGTKAGVYPSNPHRFRHTMAVSAVRAGMGVAQLQQILGHADIAMVLRYVKLAESDLATASRDHSPLDSMKLTF